ncbi:MAG: hypothetical protein RLZZ53_2030 [Acidobacteriota bacterium]|jgi:hypothetical protein
MSIDHFLVILHFVGLAMGLGSGFAQMVMARLIANASPQEKPVLGRFPPAMGKVGVIGLSLLWITGGLIVQYRYGSFSVLPTTFVYKIAAVVLLTLVVIAIQVLQRKAQKGDASAMARMQMLGRMTGPLAVIAIIFAVITFG